MTGRRAWSVAVAIALALVAGCNDKKKEPTPAKPPAGEAPAAQASADKPQADKAPAAVVPKGPVPAGTVRPILTPGGFVFAVGKDKSWGEGSFVCYSALQETGMSGGFTAMDMLKAKYPQLPDALEAADVDLNRDLVEVGGYDCGGEACIYVALALRHPDRLGTLLQKITPPDGGQVDVEAVDALHQVATFPVDGAKRHLHLRAVPVDWSWLDKAPDDPWLQRARQATHVVFMYGATEPAQVPDPMAALASPEEAAKRVAEVEKLLPDPRDRCVAGYAATTQELPGGFHMTGVRFAVAAPPRGSDDPAAAALGFSRSVSLEVSLELDKAPTDTDAQGWIAMGKSFARQAVGSQLGMLEAGLGGGMVKSLGDLLQAAFAYRIEGTSLHLGLGTRNVTSAELSAIDMQ